MLKFNPRILCFTYVFPTYKPPPSGVGSLTGLNSPLRQNANSLYQIRQIRKVIMPAVAIVLIFCRSIENVIKRSTLEEHPPYIRDANVDMPIRKWVENVCRDVKMTTRELNELESSRLCVLLERGLELASE
jgi:hypothetical protein